MSGGWRSGWKGPGLFTPPRGLPAPTFDGSGGQVPQGGLAAASPNPLMVRVFPDGAGRRLWLCTLLMLQPCLPAFFWLCLRRMGVPGLGIKPAPP